MVYKVCMVKCYNLIYGDIYNIEYSIELLFPTIIEILLINVNNDFYTNSLILMISICCKNRNIIIYEYFLKLLISDTQGPKIQSTNETEVKLGNMPESPVKLVKPSDKRKRYKKSSMENFNIGVVKSALVETKTPTAFIAKVIICYNFKMT